MLIWSCPCGPHFSDVTLKNDSDIFVVVTAVVIIRRWCCWAILRLLPHDIITRVACVGHFRWTTTYETFTRESPPEKHAQTHLQVKELAVASVDDLRAAIAPGHFDDVDLVKETRDGMSPQQWSQISKWRERRQVCRTTTASIWSWDRITLLPHLLQDPVHPVPRRTFYWSHFSSMKTLHLLLHITNSSPP